MWKIVMTSSNIIKCALKTFVVRRNIFHQKMLAAKQKKEYEKKNLFLAKSSGGCNIKLASEKNLALYKEQLSFGQQKISQKSIVIFELSHSKLP